MRILLRDSSNGLFYAGNQRWIRDSAHARDFEDTTEAIDCARLTPIECLEIVMRFDDPFLEIPLSIVPAREDENVLSEH